MEKKQLLEKISKFYPEYALSEQELDNKIKELTASYTQSRRFIMPEQDWYEALDKCLNRGKNIQQATEIMHNIRDSVLSYIDGIYDEARDDTQWGTLESVALFYYLKDELDKQS